MEEEFYFRNIKFVLFFLIVVRGMTGISRSIINHNNFNVWCFKNLLWCNICSVNYTLSWHFLVNYIVQTMFWDTNVSDLLLRKSETDVSDIHGNMKEIAAPEKFCLFIFLFTGFCSFQFELYECYQPSGKKWHQTIGKITSLYVRGKLWWIRTDV